MSNLCNHSHYYGTILLDAQYRNTAGCTRVKYAILSPCRRQVQRWEVNWLEVRLRRFLSRIVIIRFRSRLLYVKLSPVIPLPHVIILNTILLNATYHTFNTHPTIIPITQQSYVLVARSPFPSELNMYFSNLVVTSLIRISSWSLQSILKICYFQYKNHRNIYNTLFYR